MLNPPKIKVNLISITDSKSVAHWEKMTKNMSDLCRNAGGGSKTYENSLAKIRDGVLVKGIDLSQLIDKSVDIRACTELWLESDDFVQKAKVDKNILNHFQEIQKKIAYIPLYRLIRLYFGRYDKCGDPKHLARFIKVQLDLQPENYLNKEALKLKKRGQKALATKAHERVSASADKRKLALPDVLEEMGIDANSPGRFMELANSYHYLEKLASLDPQGDQAVLDEVVRSEVYETEYKDRRLGHFIIETLVKNATDRGVVIPNRWLSTILAIAKDPRVPKTSPQWQEWWYPIEQNRPNVLSRMYEWLGGLDLELFLDILGHHAANSGDEDLVRMFPKRKEFLQGLNKQKLIKGARLFLGTQASDYLRGKYPEDERPGYARISRQAPLSVIYLDLGRAHIIEGTHNFSFRIFDWLPKDSPPGNYSRESFSRRELTKGLEEQYSGEWIGSKPFKVRHDAEGRWQGKVVKKLKDGGVPVNSDLILKGDDYLYYLQSVEKNKIFPRGKFRRKSPRRSR